MEVVVLRVADDKEDTNGVDEGYTRCQSSWSRLQDAKLLYEYQEQRATYA